MTLNVICIKRDERKGLSGVETISVIWRVERCVFWAASRGPSRSRFYPFPFCSVSWEADPNRVPPWGPLASASSHPSQWETLGDQWAGLVSPSKVNPHHS